MLPSQHPYLVCFRQLLCSCWSSKKGGNSYQEVVAQSMFCYMHKKHPYFLMSIDSLKKKDEKASQVLPPNDICHFCFATSGSFINFQERCSSVSWPATRRFVGVSPSKCPIDRERHRRNFSQISSLQMPRKQERTMQMEPKNLRVETSVSGILGVGWWLLRRRPDTKIWRKKKRKESFISFMKRAMQPSRIMKILGCNLKASLHFDLFFGCRSI